MFGIYANFHGCTIVYMFVEISRVNHDVMNLVTKATGGNTWSIIPFGKCLTTMVIVRPLTGVNHFPSKWPWTWLINGRDPKYLRYLGAHPPSRLRYPMVRKTFNDKPNPTKPRWATGRLARQVAFRFESASVPWGEIWIRRQTWGVNPLPFPGSGVGENAGFFFVFFLGGSSLFLLVPLSWGGAFSKQVGRKRSQ